MKPMYHYTDNYLLNPIHPVTVNVIGCGGTGSHVISGLARMHESLLALGHRGLFVTAFDPDDVTAANIGRQMFSPADLGENKAVTLITRVNRYFGTNWRGIPSKFDQDLIKSGVVEMPVANLTLSCVDTVKARKEIKRTFQKTLRKKYVKNYDHPFAKPIYWMDYGNLQKTGQVILSTITPVLQPSTEGINILPDIFSLYSDFTSKKEDFNIPSCSVQESLSKQDLFINSILAQNGLNILWQMFRDIKIRYQGIFINLETFKSNPVAI